MLDLHTHSTASDGQLTPALLVMHANSVGLAGIALTDHDTTAGVAEAQEVAATLGLRVMPGIELSTEWKDSDVHILGYFAEPIGPLLGIIEQAREARTKRIKLIVAKLNALGIKISFDEVLSMGHDIESLGRPHVARVLLQKEIVKDIAQAFEQYLGRGRPAFAPRFKLSPCEAVKAIVASRGVAVWAHPGPMATTLITELLYAGLSGIEVFHPLHAPQVEARLLQLAKAYKLVATGGSDAHEKEAVGSKTVGDEVWEMLWARKQR